MEYIVIKDYDIAHLVKKVNRTIQEGWEPLGGMAIAMESKTLKVPVPSKRGIGLQSLETREVPTGVQTIYLQALIKR